MSHNYNEFLKQYFPRDYEIKMRGEKCPKCGKSMTFTQTMPNWYGRLFSYWDCFGSGIFSCNYRKQVCEDK